MTGQGTETGRNALAGLPAVQSRRLHRNRLYRRGERTFSSLGRRKSSTLQDSSTWNYTYNQRSEITSAIRKNASNVTQNTMRYGFDSIGNRTSSYENPTSKTYSANSLNQYTGINVVGSSSISPQYDDDGNMTGYGSWTYTWDAENRLVKAVNGTTRLEFIYDALSRRVAKKLYQGNTLSKHERYVYDGMKLLASYNAKSSYAKINTFLWQPFGADVPLIMTYGSTIYGYLVDANKNVLGLFNPSQSRVATYLYGPFGQIISSSGTMAANNPIRFSSEQFDADLGLVYYNYRYYSPEFGRWLSKDPIGEEGGWNLYAFVFNSAINNKDVLGLRCCSTKEKNDCRDGLEKAKRCAEIYKETKKKYDPIKDAIGGYPISPKKGGGYTKPGGHYPKLLETQRCIENGLSRFLKCIDCDDFDGEYPKELQDLIHEPVEEPRVHPPVHLTTPEPDIGYALTSLLIVGGIAVIIFDVATFPSGEGMIGIAMITKAIYH